MSVKLLNALECAVADVLKTLADIEDGVLFVETGGGDNHEDTRVVHFPPADQQQALWQTHHEAVDRLNQLIVRSSSEEAGSPLNPDLLRLLDRGQPAAVVDREEQLMKLQRLRLLGQQQGLEVLSELMRQSLMS